MRARVLPRLAVSAVALGALGGAFAGHAGAQPVNPSEPSSTTATSAPSTSTSTTTTEPSSTTESSLPAPTAADVASAPAPTSVGRTTATSASTTTTRAAAPRDAGAATPLLGTFELTGGSCTGTVSGTYFRMLQPGGVVNGPDHGYITNADSGCADKTYTALQPGIDGGLISGGYQPEPHPAFDRKGNALAARIVKPAVFFGVEFSLSTAPTDPQTGTAVPAPAIAANGAVLSGDLRAFGASWNAGHFNQGSPKPNGSKPGLTAGPTGTYDAATKSFTLDWTSLIVGGPFGGFTGQWHLTGHFVAGAQTTSSTAAPAAGSSATVPAATRSTAARATRSLASTGSTVDSLVVTALLALLIGATALAAGRSHRVLVSRSASSPRRGT